VRLETELVKDAEQIILTYGTEVESGGDLAIGHASSHVLDDLAFARGEKFDSFVIGGAHRASWRELKGMIQIDALRPYCLHAPAYAFAEAFDPLLLGKNSLAPARKQRGPPGRWKTPVK